MEVRFSQFWDCSNVVRVVVYDLAKYKDNKQCHSHMRGVIMQLLTSCSETTKLMLQVSNTVEHIWATCTEPIVYNGDIL